MIEELQWLACDWMGVAILSVWLGAIGNLFYIAVNF
jgi:hypothetical protein